jgi:hypothetical protein
MDIIQIQDTRSKLLERRARERNLEEQDRCLTTSIFKQNGRNIDYEFRAEIFTRDENDTQDEHSQPNRWLSKVIEERNEEETENMILTELQNMDTCRK